MKRQNNKIAIKNCLYYKRYFKKINMHFIYCYFTLSQGFSVHVFRFTL